MNFISRFGSFLLFLLLQIYSLYLVANYNEKQGEIYRSSADLYVGLFYDNFSFFNKYWNNERIADSLSRENAELKTQLEAAKYSAIVQKGLVSFPIDTSKVRPDTNRQQDVTMHFRYIAAEVVNNSIVRTENYLTINRGSAHGVKAGMGIISADGLVGIVKNVSSHYASVMSILHKQTSISAMIRRNRYFGSLVWRSTNPQYMTLENIPKHIEIRRGDTIMTSGYSEIFPPELKIGLVEDFRIENGSNSYTIDVKLFNDMVNIRYVYVVESFFSDELRNLRQATDLLNQPPSRTRRQKRDSLNAANPVPQALPPPPPPAATTPQ